MKLYNLADLGRAFNIAPKEPKERSYSCRKCGAKMRRVDGTNVYFCTGKDDEGNPCTNRMILPVKTAV